jgi:cyclic pyranopterin phosphate synthase
MPEKPFSWVPKENILHFEELFKFIQAGIDEGITKVRITGGEPLLRHDLDRFIKMIYDYKNDIDLALTTNGFLLKESAAKLKAAGLKRINVSLDSLKADVAAKIAQKNVLEQVLEGLHAADEAGLKIKINSVPLKGINDTEILDLLDYCKARNWTVRFIKFMENTHAKSLLEGLSSEEIKSHIAKKYSFIPQMKTTPSPASYYKLDNCNYEFGIIEPHKDDFCAACNRIRLTAEGYLIPCLYFEDALSIKDAIKENNIDKAVEILRTVLKNKPEKNKWSEQQNEHSARAFYETGG